MINPLRSYLPLPDGPVASVHKTHCGRARLQARLGISPESDAGPVKSAIKSSDFRRTKPQVSLRQGQLKTEPPIIQMADLIILKVSVILSVFICLLGFWFASVLQNTNLVEPLANDRETLSSLYLFVAQDKFVALLTAGFLLLAYYVRLPITSKFANWDSKHIRWLLVATFLLAVIFRVVIHHSFDLSLDEFMPSFQARIFQSGQLLAPISADALKVNENLQPFFTYVNPEHGLWASYYRPVHAALIALFSVFLHADLLNPFMAVLSVWAIADIARRIFPEHPEAPLLAAIMLVVSPQFLATAGTGFSFTSHLAFNLIWLAMFLRGSMAGHITAALVGFFAVGLHQVHVHPLFVTPFLAALLLGRFGPRKALVPYFISYGLALPIWMAWPEISIWLQTGDASILPTSVMEIDYIKDYFQYTDNVAKVEDSLNTFFLATNLFRFWLWISPALLILVFVALRYVKTIGQIPILAGLGFALMVLATHILMPNQMHGWGARYYQPVLGNFILFALGGYFAAQRPGMAAQLKQVVATLLVVSAVILLPIRAFQIEAKIAPRAAVQQALSKLNADVVFIEPDQIWFAADFVRNDPYLTNRPIISINKNLDSFDVFGATQLTIGKPELSELGLPFGTLYEPGQLPQRPN